MDDSTVNPMKTGLMFVPLGQLMSPGRSDPSPTRLRAATSGTAASRTVRGVLQAMLRRLERLWHSPGRRLPSPT